jgi:hypothetical protein
MQTGVKFDKKKNYLCIDFIGLQFFRNYQIN